MGLMIVAAAAGILLILIVLWDAFETVVLPRRVTRRLRLARLFYRTLWRVWSAVARQMRDGSRRESYLGLFGPLSLILLLVLWATMLVMGFAMLQWGLGSDMTAPEGIAGFAAILYMSGTSFFTLGLGDVVPRTLLGRAVTVVEVGTGFGFLALVIGYLPVLYQAFSRREVIISMLDARAGSPPTAAELLRRHAHGEQVNLLGPLLLEWEHWSAELLESHLSYPVLAFYRSQHAHQSWLAALTMILDVSALLIVGTRRGAAWPARLAFAMARHTAVDLCQVFNTPPRAPQPERLSAADLARLRALLATTDMRLREGQDAENTLADMRRLYEPYVNALAGRLLMPLPPWIGAVDAIDDWQTSAWEKAAGRPFSTEVGTVEIRRDEGR